jgi:hypothetical protein
MNPAGLHIHVLWIPRELHLCCESIAVTSVMCWYWDSNVDTFSVGPIQTVPTIVTVQYKQRCSDTCLHKSVLRLSIVWGITAIYDASEPVYTSTFASRLIVVLILRDLLFPFWRLLYFGMWRHVVCWVFPDVITWSRDSSVGIATGYGLDDWGVEFQSR